MKYINHFAIKEDDQFEIAAIKTIDKDTTSLELDQAIEASKNLTKQQIEHSLSDENFQNQLHILWAGDFIDLDFLRIKNCLKASIKRCGYESALSNSMLTTIKLEKLNCVTKEFVDIQYPVPSEEVESKIEENEEKKIFMEQQAYKSVGRDLEVFYKRIKCGEITKETIPDAIGERKFLRLFCLLKKDERKKLDRKDKNFYETFTYISFPDVRHDEWEKTESKHLKFASYAGWRRTAFLDTNPKPDDPLIELIGVYDEKQPIFYTKPLWTKDVDIYFPSNESHDESWDEFWGESSCDENY